MHYFSSLNEIYYRTKLNCTRRLGFQNGISESGGSAAASLYCVDWKPLKTLLFLHKQGAGPSLCLPITCSQIPVPGDPISQKQMWSDRKRDALFTQISATQTLDVHPESDLWGLSPAVPSPCSQLPVPVTLSILRIWICQSVGGCEEFVVAVLHNNTSWTPIPFWCVGKTEWLSMRVSVWNFSQDENPLDIARRCLDF